MARPTPIASTQDLRGGPGGQAFLTKAAETVRHDALVLAVVGVEEPRPEGFLAIRNVDAAAVRAWCDTGHRTDPVWREARQAGCVTIHLDRGEAAGLLPGMSYGLVHVLPASLDQRRIWLLAVGRRDAEFTDADKHHTALLLRLKQMEFDQAEEPGLGKLLLDASDRLLHADPRTDARMLESPALLTALTATLRPVIEQRWPDGLGNGPHDAVLDIDGQSTWVRFIADAPIPDITPHLYVESRQVEPADAPPIGLVKNARIAQALAYLSDHFAQAPSLSDVAAAVHVSPFHFHRLFTREVGVSPKHFLLRMQLQVAKWMLRATRRPIGEIALQTGFASHGHFTATFHRFVGVSPTTFREQAWQG